MGMDRLAVVWWDGVGIGIGGGERVTSKKMEMDRFVVG